jgi:hypothetical protein
MEKINWKNVQYKFLYNLMKLKNLINILIKFLI